MTKFPKLLTTTTAAGVLFCAAVIGAEGQDLDGRLKLIKLGLTKEATVAIMGRDPDAATSTKMVGFTYERLRWNSVGRAYVVKLIGGRGIASRVVGTKTCIGLADC